MKLEEFRLESYDEREILISALTRLREFPYYDQDVIRGLLVRLSRTECQEGGCEYCNSDRRAEADEWREEVDKEWRDWL